MSDIKSKIHLQSEGKIRTRAFPSAKTIANNGGVSNSRQAQDEVGLSRRKDEERNQRIAEKKHEISPRSDYTRKQTSICVPNLKVREPCQPKIDTNEEHMETTNIPRIRNYQIKSVKKGIPVIDVQDSNVQRIRIAQADLEITPYWICQKSKPETKRTPAAWFFSTFVVFVCVICPLTSFASDVGFYMTCSDHYNHTAEVLEEVKSKYSTQPEARYINDLVPMNHIGQDTNSLKSGATITNMPTTPQERPAPLMARHKRYLKIHKLSAQNIKIERHSETKDKRALHHNTKTHIHRMKKKRNKHLNSLKHSPDSTEKPKNLKAFDLKETNFEIEVYNQTLACDTPMAVIKYMLTEQAAVELEEHRHVTIDVFEPVFILGSFPSLVLCILTRLVVLVTGHKNFLSAYVINMACMPLQLVTGALSVHSASYHLGKRGFECWHCAIENDCSDMGIFWWLEDGVTKSLIVSMTTKLLDGVAGGLVLFVVIIRIVSSRRGHATFWWNLLRGTAISSAFLFCITVSPILVITPAISVMRLEFMELVTPFSGLNRVSSSLTILMGLGLATWGLSFAILFIYLSYSMYMFCRERTIDH